VIQRALGFLKEARNQPVHPATALMGALCVVLGAAVVQRFTQQQQAGLVHAWQQLRLAEHDVRQLEARWAEVDRARDNYPTAAKGYPADEDLDPVGRGAQVPDTELKFEDLASLGTTEGSDR
jgi:xanthosine utilization system XapX-like protein